MLFVNWTFLDVSYLMSTEKDYPQEILSKIATFSYFVLFIYIEGHVYIFNINMDIYLIYIQRVHHVDAEILWMRQILVTY